MLNLLNQRCMFEVYATAIVDKRSPVMDQDDLDVVDNPQDVRNEPDNVVVCTACLLHLLLGPCTLCRDQCLLHILMALLMKLLLDPFLLLLALLSPLLLDPFLLLLALVSQLLLDPFLLLLAAALVSQQLLFFSRVGAHFAVAPSAGVVAVAAGGAVAAVTGVVAASAGGAVAACVCHGAVCIAMWCRLVVFIASVNAAKRKRLDEKLIHAARAVTLSDM